MSSVVSFVRPAVVFGVLCAVLPGAPALAQSSAGSVEVGGHLSVLRLGEIDATDVGVGATAAWRVSPQLSIEGALTLFPGESDADGALENQRRVLGLFGIRYGVERGRVEVFGRGGAGFLRFGEQDQVVCIAIFPPPLSCRLAAGYTALGADIGGGVSIGLDAAGRMRLQIEASDLIVRYGGESFRNGDVTDGLVSHNLLFSAGVAWRF